MKRKSIIIIGFLAITLLLIQGMGMKGMTETAGAQANQVLVVVDPGFSKFSFKIGQLITEKLSQKGYVVTLITVNQFKSRDASKFDLLVFGGPTYVGQPSGGLKKVIHGMNPGTKLKTLLFVTGGSDCSGLEPLKKMAVAKGLTVLGSCGILDTAAEAKNVEPKIDQLLKTLP